MIAESTTLSRMSLRFNVSSPKQIGLDADVADASIQIVVEGETTSVRSSQLWFWSEDWQERIREAEDDLQNGRFTLHESGEDFLAAIRDITARNAVQNGE